MWPLGVLKKKNVNYLLNVNFGVLPLVDVTNRHTISSPIGVTTDGVSATYDGGATTFSTVAGNDADFAWSGDFYVGGEFTSTDLSSYRTLWDTHENTTYDSAQRLGIYTNPDGGISVYTGGVGVATTGAGAITENVKYKVELFRRGTRCYLVVDGVLKTDFGLTTIYSNANRRMYFGGSAFSQAQFIGSISSFKVYK